MAKKKENNKGIFAGLLIVLALVFGAYSFFWFQVAEAAKDSYVDELSKIGNGADVSAPDVSGYPGKMVISKAREVIASDKGSVRITDLRAASWPLPNMPIDIQTGEIELVSHQWLEGLRFDSFEAVMRANAREVVFEQSTLKQSDFEAALTGRVDLSNPDVAIPDLVVTLSNHKDLSLIHISSPRDS